jgi:hypothetical protein
MHILGEEVNYGYLLGVSGLAFRMQIGREGFCPSSPHSFCGYRCVARSTEALPWNVQIFEVKPDHRETLERARCAVVESIERGAPVQYGNEEDGIIVGYQKGGQELLCHHPVRSSREMFIETQWPWGVAVFTGRKASVAPRRDLAVGAIQQAVTMASAGQVDNYFIGFTAWTEYIARLRALDRVDESVLISAALGNAWIYECLVQYRSEAAEYLRGIAGEFQPAVSKVIIRVGALYNRMAREILSDPDHGPRSIAPYPGMLKDGGSWSAQMRDDQVTRLERALPLEREAVAGLEQVLSLVAPAV